ncbi:MAG: methionine--tRNA ligase [Patescibacteria group bacterium]
MARYITTTLPYVNADPHIGFALEVIQADTLSRLWRLQGEEVFYFLGTDEHGQKVWEAAEAAGVDVQAYTKQYAEEVQKLTGALALNIDARMRTSDTAHYTAAQEMWRQCEAAGDIYKKNYTGLYCIGCEAYKTKKDLDEQGKCVLHPSLTPQEISEENYFFRYSNYGEQLLQYLSDESVILPDWRREEAIAFVKGGLEDFSISREKAKLSWGVPVPGDESQVMYVWFDALTSYISVLGWPAEKERFEKFWENGRTLQMGGKDQVRFQSLMWQAMLMSAKIKNTEQIFYHGFINSGGQRMSKSLGNVISPYDLVEKYGTDATRYLLLRHVHPAEDSDVTWERLDEWYLANLVNGLGNLVARVMKLAEDNLTGPVQFVKGDMDIDPAFTSHLNEFRFNEAVDYIFAIIGECDAYMTAKEPYKKVKSPDDGIANEGREDITFLVRKLALIGTHLAPVMPATSERVLNAVQGNTKPENLFPRLT